MILKVHLLIFIKIDEGRPSNLSESYLRENFYERIIDLESMFYKSRDIKHMHELIDMYKVS